MDYMEVENTIDLKGKVVKWCDTWGVVNFYREGIYNEAPRKAFIHVSKVVAGTPRPDMGSRVIFDLGPARSATELPQALRVRVATSSDVL
jgi:hypothetical protein